MDRHDGLLEPHQSAQTRRENPPLHALLIEARERVRRARGIFNHNSLHLSSPLPQLAQITSHKDVPVPDEQVTVLQDLIGEMLRALTEEESNMNTFKRQVARLSEVEHAVEELPFRLRKLREHEGRKPARREQPAYFGRYAAERTEEDRQREQREEQQRFADQQTSITGLERLIQERTEEHAKLKQGIPLKRDRMTAAVGRIVTIVNTINTLLHDIEKLHVRTKQGELPRRGELTHAHSPKPAHSPKRKKERKLRISGSELLHRHVVYCVQSPSVPDTVQHGLHSAHSLCVSGGQEISTALLRVWAQGQIDAFLDREKIGGPLISEYVRGHMLAKAMTELDESSPQELLGKIALWRSVFGQQLFREDVPSKLLLSNCQKILTWETVEHWLRSGCRKSEELERSLSGQLSGEDINTYWRLVRRITYPLFNSMKCTITGPSYPLAEDVENAKLTALKAQVYTRKTVDHYRGALMQFAVLTHRKNGEAVDSARMADAARELYAFTMDEALGQATSTWKGVETETSKNTLCVGQRTAYGGLIIDGFSTTESMRCNNAYRRAFTAQFLSCIADFTLSAYEWYQCHERVNFSARGTPSRG